MNDTQQINQQLLLSAMQGNSRLLDGNTRFELRNKIRNAGDQGLAAIMLSYQIPQERILELLEASGQYAHNTKPMLSAEDQHLATSPDAVISTSSNGQKSVLTWNPTDPQVREIAQSTGYPIQIALMKVIQELKGGQEAPDNSQLPVRTQQQPSTQKRGTETPASVGGRDNRQRKKIGEILLERQLIAAHEINLPEVELIKRVPETDFYEALAINQNKAFIDPSVERPDPAVRQLLPDMTIESLRVYPYRIENGNLILLVSDSRVIRTLRAAQQAVKNNHQIHPAIATPSAISALVDANLNKMRAIDALNREGERRSVAKPVEIEADSNNPVVQAVNQILREAINTGASDIHIETKENVEIRYRIDGKLRRMPSKISGNISRNVIARIKSMAELDTTVTRVPQDGRIRFRTEQGEVEFRLSTIPTQANGNMAEKAVMRQLSRGSVPPLGKLGLTKKNGTLLTTMVSQPNGILIVSGPTGSGKTTTCNSLIQHIASDEINITSIEEPVEYEISAINQTQVDRPQGLDFARALRAFLRQDPDVIFIGEIRDSETAKIAVEAANTGHLVIATLHTNDAPEIITRLVQMGVPGYQLGSALVGGVAQRLVRKLCPHCRTQAPPSEKAIMRLGVNPSSLVWTPNAEGCKHCSGGYKGRIAIHEIMINSDEMRDAIVSDASTSRIRKIALENHMRVMRQDGLLKAQQGVTSIYEVMDITRDEMTGIISDDDDDLS